MSETARALWTPERIQQLRHHCAENTATFGARFGRSGRAVEDWEQGRRTPDALVRRELGRLDARRHHQPPDDAAL